MIWEKMRLEDLFADLERQKNMFSLNFLLWLKAQFGIRCMIF